MELKTRADAEALSDRISHVLATATGAEWEAARQRVEAERRANNAAVLERGRKMLEAAKT